MKPYRVVLQGGCLSTIRMQCTVLSDDQEIIPHKLEQTDCNTFSISVSSKSIKRSNIRSGSRTIENSGDTLNSNRKRLNVKTNDVTIKRNAKGSSTNEKTTVGGTGSNDRENLIDISTAQKTTNLNLRSKRKRSADDSTDEISSKNKNQNKRKKGNASKAIVRVNALLPQPCTDVQIGEIVLCKMRGFPAWPARVTSIDANIINVTYFGDNTTWKTAIIHLYPFNLSHSEIILNIKKRKDPLYAKSVHEAEHALKIPKKYSIFNKL